MNGVSITPEFIADYITATFAGVHVVEAWGDTFFFYNPDQQGADEIYFATLKSQDDDYDHFSNLNRPSVFRLNISLDKSTFRSLFGMLPSHTAAQAATTSPYDYTLLDQLMPHPVYGRQYWVSVLNPSEATFQTVQPLLAEAYALAASKYAKRAARG